MLSSKRGFFSKQSEKTDKPHFQCRTGKSLKQLRQLKKLGQPIPILPGAEKVAVFVKGAKKKVPALFMNSRTWVGAKDFTSAVGGTLIKAGGKPFSVSISMGGTNQAFRGIIIGKVGYVKFADLNQLFNLDFMFNSQQKELNIL